jgi:hypothetical protein
MKTINLVGSAIAYCVDRPELTSTPRDGLCAITGCRSLCIPRSEVVPKSNTDMEIFSAPKSDMASVNAFYCFKYRPERASSWISTATEFKKLNRTDVRKVVVENLFPNEPWAMYITTSYKKHGSLYSPTNINSCVVRFEMLNIDLSNRKLLMEIWDRLNQEIRNGIGRSILESLDCSVGYISKIGLQRWIDFEAWARPLFRSPLYQFLCYLLPSQEELKNERS